MNYSKIAVHDNISLSVHPDGSGVDIIFLDSSSEIFRLTGDAGTCLKCLSEGGNYESLFKLLSENHPDRTSIEKFLQQFYQVLVEKNILVEV